MIITMVLGSVLIGPMIHYFHWLGIGITYLVFLIGIIASTKLEKIKIKNDIETYDRILAFINGKDPKEVQKVSLEIYGHPQFLLFSLLV